MDPIFLKPELKTLIWGTEQWGISAHPNGDDEILNDQFKGLHLSELWEKHRELFGGVSGDRFPLLTKIIDARQDLSIQVHPDDDYAGVHENGSLGKTECWYIMDCEPDTKIVIGHNAKNSTEVRNMIEAQQWKDFIREVPVHKGDFFFIEPGTVHAIKGGTVILETQQSSDITYRVYDYDRLQDGKKRPLHVQQSIDVISAPYESKECPFDDKKNLSADFKQLVSCNLFTVWKGNVSGKVSFEQKMHFLLCSVIEGSGTINGKSINKADHFILPSGFGNVELCGNMELIFSSI